MSVNRKIKEIWFALLIFLMAISGCITLYADNVAAAEFDKSIEGDIATVIVRVSGCDSAKTMLIEPIYDNSAIELTSGEWVVSGSVIADDWKKSTGDAVIAFSKNTDINGDIFKMTFKLIDKSDLSAVDTVTCKLIIKSVVEGSEINIPISVEGYPPGCYHKNKTDVPSVTPKCTEPGYTAGVFCNDCETYITGHEAVGPIGHSYGDAMYNDKTFHWKQCDLCGNREDVNEHVKGAEATFNSPQICTVCEYIIADKLHISDSPYIPPEGEYETETEPLGTDVEETSIFETENEGVDTLDLCETSELTEPVIDDSTDTEEESHTIDSGVSVEDIGDEESEEIHPVVPDNPEKDLENENNKILNVWTTIVAVSVLVVVSVFVFTIVVKRKR